jgi:sulfoxide reductase heme-binding subunit YedZ
MEFIDERQQSPLIVGVGLLFFFMAISYGLVHLVYTSPAMSNRYFWYMERSAGFTAYELLATTVILGVSSSSGIWDRLKLRKLVTQLHQFSSILILPFVVLHLWGLHEDSTIPFPWQHLFVPFLSTYHPLTTSFGILALYGVVILLLSSYWRDKLSPNVWRGIHYSSFPIFLIVTIHGLFTGTDAHQTWWGIWLYLIPFAAFTFLLILRIQKD